jgi:hypothetical protein
MYQRPQNKTDQIVGDFFHSKVWRTIRTCLFSLIITILVAGLCLTLIMVFGVGAPMLAAIKNMGQPLQGTSAFDPGYQLTIPTSTQNIEPTNTIQEEQPSIIWAAGSEKLTQDIRDALGQLLFTDPPAEGLTNVYGVSDITITNDVWGISIVNINPDRGNYDWNMERNVIWAGSVNCSQIQTSWSCSYFIP